MGALAMTQGLGQSPGAVAQDLERWMGHLAADMRGEKLPDELQKDLVELRFLDARSLERTFDLLLDQLDYGVAQRVFSARDLMDRLDSRPDHLFVIGRVAMEGHMDMELAELVYTQLARLTGDSNLQPATVLAGLRGETEKMFALLRQPQLLPKDRAFLFWPRKRRRPGSAWTMSIKSSFN